MLSIISLNKQNGSHHHTFQTYIETVDSQEYTQKPHTLWIGCTDSPFSPKQLFGANRGGIRVYRSFGNMIPLPNNDPGIAAFLAHSLARFSNVRTIIVCGHNRCEAMDALIDSSHGVAESPLAWWLAQAERILEHIPVTSSSLDLNRALVKANLDLQMEQLCQYPGVSNRLDGTLTIYGVVYDITSNSLRELKQVRFPEKHAAARRLWMRSANYKKGE